MKAVKYCYYTKDLTDEGLLTTLEALIFNIRKRSINFRLIPTYDRREDYHGWYCRIWEET